jgi:hypothetical protein
LRPAKYTSHHPASRFDNLVLLMASRAARRAKHKRRCAEAPVSARTVVYAESADLPDSFTGFPFHAAVFLIAFLIVCSRRPDVILNPQFYAEDGAYWFADAYRFGLHSLLMTQSSYLHTFTRIVALTSLFFSFFAAPLVMNFCAITVQILPVSVLLSSRFSDLSLRTRVLGSFLYLALPNTFETNANISNVQWRLALLACLLLMAKRPHNWAWRIFDSIVLVLTSLDGPMGIFLVPVAAALWWKRRQGWQKATLWLLLPGAVIQTLTVLLNLQTRQPPHVNLAGQVIVDGGANGATIGRLIHILGRQVFFSSLLGLKAQSWLLELHSLHLVEMIAAALGVAVLLYSLRYGPVELRLFILFAFAVFAAGLARPLAGTQDRPQWEWLCVPACGNRYYFLPMLAFLASLLWMAIRSASPRALRYFALALLSLLPIGIYRDWRYPAFVDYHFQEYAEQFDRVPPGTTLVIPINPDWAMELTKR